MSHETEFPEAGVVWTFHGTISYEEIVAANSEVWNREDWDELQYQIVDFTDVESVTIDDEDTRAVGHMDKIAVQRRRSLKVALIAVKPEVAEVCRAYVDLVDGESISAAVFSNRVKAHTWART